MQITFDPLTEQDFPLLNKWLETPHVKDWWDQDVHWTPQLISEKYDTYVHGYKNVNGEPKKIAAYIIKVSHVPIGYIQLYNAHDFHKDTALKSLPKSLATFDVYIGEPEYIGKNIGSKAIEIFLEKFCIGKYVYAFVDPKSSNIAAIKAYEAAGFIKTGLSPTRDVIWMIKKLDRNNQMPREVVSRLNAVHYTWGNNCDAWSLKPKGEFTVASESMPAGSSETRHLSNIFEQFFFCLDGVLTIELEETEYVLHREDSLIVHHGAPYRLSNKTTDTTRFLVVSSQSLYDEKVDLNIP